QALIRWSSAPPAPPPVEEKLPYPKTTPDGTKEKSPEPPKDEKSKDLPKLEKSPEPPKQNTSFSVSVLPEMPAREALRPAVLTVHLPSDATLAVEGVPTRSTSAVRRLETPPLVVGQSYSYLLTAECVRGGQKQVVSQRVFLRGGEETSVILTPRSAG